MAWEEGNKREKTDHNDGVGVGYVQKGLTGKIECTVGSEGRNRCRDLLPVTAPCQRGLPILCDSGLTWPLTVGARTVLTIPASISLVHSENLTVAKHPGLLWDPGSTLGPSL